MPVQFRDYRFCIIEDLKRLTGGDYSILKMFRYLITSASFKVTFWFRIGAFLKAKHSLLFLFVKIIYKHIQYKTGIQLPFETKIGPGLNFAHFSGIVINPNVEIGRNCTIFQNVTIGFGKGKGSPTIGDNVLIAAGAIVAGKIKIGNDVFIGANSLVIDNVPDESTVGGNPARVLNRKGKENVAIYNK